MCASRLNVPLLYIVRFVFFDIYVIKTALLLLDVTG